MKDYLSFRFAINRRWLISRLGFCSPGLHVGVRKRDIFLASYPKSGNTWLRFLIASLLFRQADFQSVERDVPDIYQRQNFFLWFMRSPRYLKTHEAFTRRYRNVVYIYRDPVSVCFSYYRHILKVRNLQWHDYPIEEHIEKFLSGNLDRFGSWNRHVSGWLHQGQNCQFFSAIKYEDLLTNAEVTLGDIATQLNLGIKSSQIQYAVESASRDRMQFLEKKQGAKWKPMRNSSGRYKFVGDGGSSSIEEQWAEIVTEEVKSRWAETLALAGYRYD